MEILKTAEDIQNEYARIFGCHGVWDRYSQSEDEILLEKLRQIFRQIPEPNDEDDSNNEEIRRDNEKLVEQRNNIFKKLWHQRIYCDGNLKMAIIYVLRTSILADDQPIRMARDATSYVCHPVFRIWKCSVQGSALNCCNIFIDENGRVYRNWNDFISNNIYPEGVLIAPKNGIYRLNENDAVRLEFHLTANSTFLRKTTRQLDTAASAIGALSALTVIIPFPPLNITSMIVNASITVYTMGRSIDNLIDKGQHGQSISILNRQARLDWFNIIASGISLGASATTVRANQKSKGKNISKEGEPVLGGVNLLAVTVNSVNVANAAIESVIRYKDNEQFSTLEILQLSQSLVLFTHSVHNWRVASEIIKESNVNVAQVHLSGQIHQEETNFFNRATEEIQRLTHARSINNSPDIFRCLNEIPDCLSLIYSAGLPVLSLSGIEQSYLMERTQEIIDRFFVASEVALNNCLKIVSKVMNICNQSIDYMMMITDKFLTEVKNSIETRIRPLISYENVLWDIFNISLKLSDINPINTMQEASQITEDFLKNNYIKIMNALKKLYSEYFKENPTQKIKCNLCDGFYEKCELRN